MSTAKLNVWITEFGDPCHIMEQHGDERWFVHIVDCEGKPLNWCGKEYAFLPAKCGHLEIEIPPGCYAVFAGHTPRSPKMARPPFGNRLTHVQVVRANCGDHVCVTLFSPELWHCGSWFKDALQTQAAMLEAAQVDPKLTRAAEQAVQAVLDQMEPTGFTANLEAFKKDPPRQEKPKGG